MNLLTTDEDEDQDNSHRAQTEEIRRKNLGWFF
jgi:hypothetical protein